MMRLRRVKNSGWLCHSVGSYKSLSFAGKSDYLVTVSGGSQPQLSVCSMSKLSVSWSYKLQVEDVACAFDASMFAVLVV
ncbi:hypothetical protein G4B88_020648, partial [Cannabis sativa]